MKNKGRYLKEVSIDFLIKNKITIEEAKGFLFQIVGILETEIVSVGVNDLPPGFDILIGIKESCVYLGYWPEYNFVHLILSSCKDYDEEKIVDFIEKYYNTKVQITTSRDDSIERIVKGFK